ncbi:MAG: hypothetical protein KDA20_07415 [Phycisphaerales bacterium]|nr:hypothetical protein [Phycisphaerales bacterium]
MRGMQVIVAATGLAMCAGSSVAQFNPTQGQWGKDDPNDIRVMTWNVRNALSSGTFKADGNNPWGGITRIVSALKPDVLIMQECGDGDAVGTLQTVIDLFLHGGTDPFLGGTVTGYVQLHDPAFDMPYVYVSSAFDGFNRNVILSRYPFVDLNGDGKSTYPDSAFVTSTGTYAAGGTGGIRGFGFAEIDLPDATYAGDLVQGFAHLKAGGLADDLAQRLNAAKNVAYYVDYFYNGGGTGTVDPFNKISDFPAATSILDASTVVVMGGDWNEDEATNGRKGPAEWLTQAEFAGGTDGLDYDRTDSVYDAATDAIDGSTHSFGSSSKLDYLAWQDSKATARHEVIFDTRPLTTISRPPELVGVTRYKDLSGDASDHLCVFVDLILDLAPSCMPCANVAAGGSAGTVDLTDLNLVLFNFGTSVTPGANGDTNCDGTVDLTDLNAVLFDFGSNVGCGP